MRGSRMTTSMPTPRIYYVRHGLTDWNLEGRLQGHRDVPLNDRGRAQAVHCGELLRELLNASGGKPQDCHYVSSPLVRASETMEIMRANLGLDRSGYHIEPRLVEIGFGEWEGLTYREVLKREPQVIARRERDKWRFRSPGGETYEEVAQRIAAWHATLEQDTVVAAHGGTGRALIAVLGLAAPDQAVHRSVDQGLVYVFEDHHVVEHA
jgi:probable phosphoglycerate mutase